MISAKKGPDGVVEVRLQRIFLNADDSVLDEIGSLIRGDKTRRAALRGFIDSQFLEAPGEARPPRRALPDADDQAFSHHDIQKYGRDLNRLYLQGRSTALICWGKRSTRRSRRSIRFACYDPERNMIIMNRKLDRDIIPGYFVEYVLFHEMLHEVLGIDIGPGGKRIIHGKLFRLMEKTFPDYDKAVRFEKELCQKLGTLL